jgi:CheY-like chemotaxis protein
MGKRVLLADDSATIQRAFAMVFGAHADIALVAAKSFDEAVAAARQGRPDLVIADARLGNRTGYELCAAMKADSGLRGVPVFILASSHTPYDEGKGRDAGADGHLIKPFESQGLIDKVNDILSRPVAVAPPARDPHLGVAPAAARPAARPAPAALADDDEYGDFKIERSSGSSPVPAGVRPAPASAPASAPAAATMSSRPANLGAPMPAPAARPPSVSGYPPAGAAPAPGLRPSLIPGARPGMVPGRLPLPAGTPAPLPTRAPPGTMPPPANVPAGRPAPAPAPPGYGLGSAAPSAQSPASASRTIMGLPAVAIPGMAPRPAPGGSPSPAAPAPTPGMPAARPQPAPVPAPAAAGPAPSPFQARPPIDIGAAISSRVEQRVEQKMSSIAARGPEYEAIAKLSREVIEQVVWEVVPELAEIIIREHVERLASSRK